MTAKRETNPLTSSTPQGEVAVEPFKSNSLEIRREGGIVIPTNRNTLTGLKVIFGSYYFATGDTVFFEAEQCASLWGKKVYVLDDGTKFLLAPAGNVKLVERAPAVRPPPPEPTSIPGGGVARG